MKAVEPISMGACILHGNEAEAGSDGEHYMMAKFERIVRSMEVFFFLKKK